MAQMPLFARKRPLVPDSLLTLTVAANGVPITMQRVEGGSFVMGATPDQHDPDTYTDKPAHLVFLSPFYIAATEVTSRLWHAVMQDSAILLPSGYHMNPVAFVSWYDAQEFVRRLDSITGLPFRLPTEAEWEYAARGGNKSRHYRFAGGDKADSVGWTYAAAGQWTHPVARKQPNELGLYDMTGNVAEWCHDRYGPYRLNTDPDPCGADTGCCRIVRGGSYDECAANSHLSVRRWYAPETQVGYIGFRVALTLPDDPMKRTVPEEPELTQKIRLKGRRLHFALVPGEKPFYISDEISVAQWKKIMSLEPPDTERGAAVGMSRQERLRFAETCSRLAERPFAVASLEDVEKAWGQGVIPPPDEPEQTKSVRAVQRSRRARRKLSPLTELVGVRLSQPDDPVLLQFRSAAEENRPLRLVIRL